MTSRQIGHANDPAIGIDGGGPHPSFQKLLIKSSPFSVRAIDQSERLTDAALSSEQF
jgi:hypothetical protein